MTCDSGANQFNSAILAGRAVRTLQSAQRGPPPVWRAVTCNILQSTHCRPIEIVSHSARTLSVCLVSNVLQCLWLSSSWVFCKIQNVKEKLSEAMVHAVHEEIKMSPFIFLLCTVILQFLHHRSGFVCLYYLCLYPPRQASAWLATLHLANCRVREHVLPDYSVIQP